MHERLGRPVEGAAVAQVAVERHARLARVGVVEARGWQAAERPPLLGQALPDREASRGVQAAVADPIAPGSVLLVELVERGDLPAGPEARLQVAHRTLDRALLPGRLRRAGG
jgi:hypothetical protein